MEEKKVYVQSWKITDKFYCPKCKNEVKYPKYECTKCNIRLKIKVALYK